MQTQLEHYFTAKTNYFWRWAENGTVIEWVDGDTICYREDLMIILKGLAHEGLPSLGSLLLTIAACQNSWKGLSSQKLKLVETSYSVVAEGIKISEKVKAVKVFRKSFRLLDIIGNLPPAFRTGNKRIHLLQEIFKSSRKSIGKDISEDFLEQFGSGQFDDLIFFNKEATAVYSYFREEFKWLSRVLVEFTDKTLLETKLLTGITLLPNRLDLNVPEKKESQDLIEQLLEDSQTHGLAQLCQRLIAAINIPMHTKHAGELPLGGVADITNKGDIDRLLLSELAYDDTTLMARLANKEAMYLRREEPPEDFERQRCILIDTTIRMWGVPRVFAVSAALACALKNQDQEVAETFVLSGYDVIQSSLSTKEGVIETLTHLHADLHPGMAMQEFLNDQKHSANREVFLITHETTFHSVEFQKMFREYQHRLHFVLTLNGQGLLHFYEFQNGHRKLISQTKYDLEEILFNTKKIPKRKKEKIVDLDLPAFYSMDPLPIRYPTTQMRLRKTNCFQISNSTLSWLIAINDSRRVFFWQNENKAPLEIIEYLEMGKHVFQFDGVQTIHLLLTDPTKELVKLYSFDVIDHELRVIDYSGQIPSTHSYNNFYEDNHFYFYVSGQNRKAINCDLGEVLNIENKRHIYKPAPLHNYDFSQLKRMINNGYHVLQNAKYIGINKDAELVLNNRKLQLRADGNIYFLNNTPQPTNIIRFQEFKVGNNPNTHFSQAVWKDGSTAIFDSRGVLHLKSSDPNIPEISLLFIVDKATACWIDDGYYAGGDYFKPTDHHKTVSPSTFYKSYIQKFIACLR